MGLPILVLNHHRTLSPSYILCYSVNLFFFGFLLLFFPSKFTSTTTFTFLYNMTKQSQPIFPYLVYNLCHFHTAYNKLLYYLIIHYRGVCHYAFSSLLYSSSLLYFIIHSPTLYNPSIHTTRLALQLLY